MNRTSEIIKGTSKNPEGLNLLKNTLDVFLWLAIFGGLMYFGFSALFKVREKVREKLKKELGELK